MISVPCFIFNHIWHHLSYTPMLNQHHATDGSLSSSKWAFDSDLHACNEKKKWTWGCADWILSILQQHLRLQPTTFSTSATARTMSTIPVCCLWSHRSVWEAINFPEPRSWMQPRLLPVPRSWLSLDQTVVYQSLGQVNFMYLLILLKSQFKCCLSSSKSKSHHSTGKTANINLIFFLGRLKICWCIFALWFLEAFVYAWFKINVFTSFVPISLF
jgi:hypothetical protein